jgi:hypothetical protein
MMPRASIRIGELDPVDIESFPPHLRRLLKIETVMLVGCAVWMVIVFVLLKFKSLDGRLPIRIWVHIAIKNRQSRKARLYWVVQSRRQYLSSFSK